MAEDRTLAARLPGPLGELARRGHGGAALILVRERGGLKMYVPARPQPSSPVVAMIGAKAAGVLADICGSAHIDVPSRGCLEESLKAAVLRAAGSTRDIAQATGATERYVRMVRNSGQPQGWRQPRRAKPKDERQIDLEGWLAEAKPKP